MADGPDMEKGGSDRLDAALAPVSSGSMGLMGTTAAGRSTCGRAD